MLPVKVSQSEVCNKQNSIADKVKEARNAVAEVLVINRETQIVFLRTAAVYSEKHFPSIVNPFNDLNDDCSSNNLCKKRGMSPEIIIIQILRLPDLMHLAIWIPNEYPAIIKRL